MANNFLTRLFSSSVETRNSSTVLSNPASWFLSSFGLLTASGEQVTSRGSLAINAVYVSSKIIGESLASLSFSTYRKNGNSREPVETAAKQLLSVSPDPDNGVTAADFWKAVGVQVCTHGNAYARIHRDADERPFKLELYYPWHIQVHQASDGMLIYKHATAGDYSPDEILHFKNFSWDGIYGANPIHEQRELIGLAKKQSKYAGSMYGEKPVGYIATDERLTTEQMEQVREFWKDQSNTNGVAGQSGTPVLGHGMKFHHIPLNPADLQYIDSSNLTEDDIYSMYRIPPPIRGDYSRATFANAEQSELVFMKHTILPYAVAFEQEINLKLFPVSNRMSMTPLFSKFNMNSTMRADFKSRTEGYQTLISNGVVSPNEVRALEDMNPREGGDKYYVPMNLVESDRMMDVLAKNSNTTRDGS